MFDKMKHRGKTGAESCCQPQQLSEIHASRAKNGFEANRSVQSRGKLVITPVMENLEKMSQGNLFRITLQGMRMKSGAKNIDGCFRKDHKM